MPKIRPKNFKKCKNGKIKITIQNLTISESNFVLIKLHFKDHKKST